MLDLAEQLQLNRIEEMVMDLLRERRESQIAYLQATWACENQSYTEGWTAEQHERQRLHRKALIDRMKQIP
ncbi:MAG: hypothetical protein P4L99_28025 [Chthoniobacter sp.]|nr:hypothetical protein [Chthoniobacter sp.]